VQKPWENERLLSIVRTQVDLGRALRRGQRLEAENRLLRDQPRPNLIAESPTMKPILEMIARVGPADANVLITGENGTGKGLIAMALHAASARAARAMVTVNAGGLPEGVFESELFGHVKGAFTDARTDRVGRFELADGGTLFLDEIGDIPLSMQVALLRVLETREFMRVGGQQPVTVDVRLVAATNRSLEQAVAEGRFREDLYYRLKVVALRDPPLREHASDIPPLVQSFLDGFVRESGRPLPKVSPEAMARLMAYGWPGNVRELRNTIEHVFLFHESNEIAARDLPPNLGAAGNAGDAWKLPVGPQTRLEDAEKEIIRQTMLLCNGNITHAANQLGISRRTLQRRLKEIPS
jgi:DNA-binding NtrC family response regulator